MRNLTLHKFLAMLLMTVSCATLSVAQNVAQKVAKTGDKEYANAASRRRCCNSRRTDRDVDQ